MKEETIDMTPTWEAILPIYLTVMRHGTYEGVKVATEELSRMARLADLWVEHQKKNK